MEIRDRALLRVALELLLEPRLLRAPRVRRKRRVRHDLAVQRNDFPLAEIVRVIAKALRAGALAEDLVVRLAEAVIEIMIPDGWPEVAHDALGRVTPRWPPAGVPVGHGAIGIHMVADGKNRIAHAGDAVFAGNAVDECSGPFVV